MDTSASYTNTLTTESHLPREVFFLWGYNQHQQVTGDSTSGKQPISCLTGGDGIMMTNCTEYT